MSNTEITEKNVENNTEPPTEGSQAAPNEEKTEEKEAAKTDEKPTEQSEVQNQDNTENVGEDVDKDKEKPLVGHDTILEEGYDDVLRQDVLERNSTDSDDSDDSVGSYVKQKELVMPPDFFEVLGNVPDLAEISEDVSVIVVLESLSQASAGPEVIEDQGKFVDPVTGEALQSSEEEPPPAVAAEVVDEEAIDEEVEEEEEEDDDLLAAQEVEDDADLAKQPDEQDVFETFLEIEPEKKVVIEDAVDWEALEREAAARRLIESTEDFIDTLIAKVVEKCEYVDPNTVLRENLDKEKLMQELESKLFQYDVEQRARQFLNRKTVEYFRRKKAFRSIIDDQPDVIQQEIFKYKEAVKHLDSVLGKENETKECTKLKLGNLHNELHEWQQNSREQIHKLEELMRKTLLRDNFDRLKLVLEGLLTRMGQLRDEVSECRLILLQRQHTFAVLVEKLEKLEDLGNGLRMRDFEHLQTETQALGKKIEERNAELSKLRTRCNADLHIMAHMKEKQQMIRNTISVQESALADLLEEKQYCRERLYSLKLSRERVRKEMHELSFQGGLLDKPALMLDYDDTSERLDKLRVKVEQMRNRYAEIQQKILTIEKKCDDNN